MAVSASGELYLTDLIALAADEGCPASVVVADDAAEAMGINDRVALADAERRMQRRIATEHMRNGVTIVDPETTRIDAGVEIGQDARIEPWTVLSGATVIAQDAVIGPNAQVRDSRIGPRTTVWASVVEESTVAEDVQIGPFAHLRPGAQVGARCRIGNFAEIKNSRLGAGTQQHHFSYLGDAEIGENVNVGAGIGHRKLRRPREAPHDGRRPRQPRSRYDDGGAGHDRRGRDHRRRVGGHARRSSRQDGRRHPGAADRCRSAPVRRDGRGAARPGGAERNPQ